MRHRPRMSTRLKEKQTQLAGDPGGLGDADLVEKDKSGEKEEEP